MAGLDYCTRKYGLFGKGLQTFRLTANTALFNINWFELSFLSENLPTGLDKFDQKNLVKVYPNPSLGDFEIRLAADDIPQSVVLYNITGKRLYEIPPSIKDHAIIINQQLRQGIYILAIQMKNENFFQKVIINDGRGGYRKKFH